MKTLTIIILLIAVSTQAQDTVHKYIDYGKPTQIHYIGIISGSDTTWKEIGKGTSLINSKARRSQTSNYDRDHYLFQTGTRSSQGHKEQTDTLEIIQELQNIQKAYKELYEQKVKALETSDTDLLRLQGIILYLNEKLNNARKK